MIIGVPRETQAGETRVALVPGAISALTRDGHEVIVQSGAGFGASIADDEYMKAGARVVHNASALFEATEAVLKVQPPAGHEVDGMRTGSTYVGFLAPHLNRATIESFLPRKVTSFSMEYVPRISRAQSMDALSSMATVAGYKAVLIATEHLGKMFPLMMTAAGTVPPAIVLVLGVGVAGLQAIATAKRLGARVEAFDPRPAVRDQVKSLGATFIEMELPKEDVETKGGYAKEQSAEFIRKEMEAIAGRLPKVDVVISTAQIFGKRAPILINADMVQLMRRGTVIVDLAAEQGGNCELTQAGMVVEHNGVKIVGAVNLPATMPIDASLMYSKNIVNLFRHLYPQQDPKNPMTIPDFNDEIVKGACITRNGEVVNESIKQMFQQGGQRS